MLISAADLGPFVVGAADLEPGVHGGLVPQRLPASARRQIDDPGFGWVASCPAGVRIRVASVGAAIDLTAAATTVANPGQPQAPVSFIVRRAGSRTVVPLVAARPAAGAGTAAFTVRPHSPRTVRIPAANPGPVDVLLPHNARVELLSLRSDGPLRPAPEAGRRWTHYGSSISHGLNAEAPDRTWPQQAASTLGWSLRDLSFSGNAQLDGCVARAIRDAPADIVTLKVGINLVNADSMRERTFRPAVHAFLDTIRDGMPEVPIVLISAISCPIQEDAAGPTVIGADGIASAARRDIAPDLGALTLSASRDILAAVVAGRADPHLSYLDGRELFGPADTALLYDRLHPDQAGLDLIARRFAARFAG